MADQNIDQVVGQELDKINKFTISKFKDYVKNPVEEAYHVSASSGEFHGVTVVVKKEDLTVIFDTQLCVVFFVYQGQNRIGFINLEVNRLINHIYFESYKQSKERRDDEYVTITGGY